MKTVEEKAQEYGQMVAGVAGIIDQGNGVLPCVITPLLTDKEIEEYIWEEISIPLSQIDIDTQSDGYIQYLNAVYWAKWGRDNCNGL